MELSAQTLQQGPTVLLVERLGLAPVATLLARYGMQCEWLADGTPIPGSYWGETEAGLVGNDLLVRGDTPVHSILHEAGHYVCMTPARRLGLHTDAGGDYAEENAVCFTCRSCSPISCPVWAGSA